MRRPSRDHGAAHLDACEWPDGEGHGRPARYGGQLSKMWRPSRAIAWHCRAPNVSPLDGGLCRPSHVPAPACGGWHRELGPRAVCAMVHQDDGCGWVHPTEAELALSRRESGPCLHGPWWSRCGPCVPGQLVRHGWCLVHAAHAFLADETSLAFAECGTASTLILHRPRRRTSGLSCEMLGHTAHGYFQRKIYRQPRIPVCRVGFGALQARPRSFHPRPLTRIRRRQCANFFLIACGVTSGAGGAKAKVGGVNCARGCTAGGCVGGGQQSVTRRGGGVRG